jgi:hypothetical protein
VPEHSIKISNNNIPISSLRDGLQYLSHLEVTVYCDISYDDGAILKLSDGSGYYYIAGDLFCFLADRSSKPRKLIVDIGTKKVLHN